MCQNLFSRKSKKNIKLSSSELAQRVVKVKQMFILSQSTSKGEKGGVTLSF